MYKKISDYGVIGNLKTIALIGADSSIDWLCLPHLDSASVFAAVLDNEKGGRFSVKPVDHWDSVAKYVDGANVLVTDFRTRNGVLRVTDFMPLRGESEEERFDCYAYLCRKVELLNGEVEVVVEFAPSFDYARAGAFLELENTNVRASGKDETLILTGVGEDCEIRGNRARVKWRLQEGDQRWLNLYYGREDLKVEPGDEPENLLQGAILFWRGWLGRSETGKEKDFKQFQPMMDRSALALKLLSFSGEGSIAAAATTSLPESVGGSRNWDYRFSWIRDSSLTIQALYTLGHLSEMENYLEWMEKVIRRSGDELQIMYGLRGETDLPEIELDHLDGYKGSRPVRIGNGAAKQKQLDIYGEILDSALKLSNYVGKVDIELWVFLRDLCDYVADHWTENDSGIWEVRGGPRSFVYSKMMCWVALDRGLTIAKRYGFPADLEKWKSTKGKIKSEVLERGWSKNKKAFTLHYDTDALDAGNLLMPIFGFLPYDDERIISTVEAIQRELSRDGFVYRYISDDGLPGDEGAFIICSFWLVHNLIGQGRHDEAEAILGKLEGAANHLGLFSEEYDLQWREALGNIPQAFSHVGYVNAVAALIKSKRVNVSKDSHKLNPGHLIRKYNVFHVHELNRGETEQVDDPRRAATSLKKIMNKMRGAFFNPSEGRVAYEEMKDTGIFKDYVNAAKALQGIDLRLLRTWSERMAFWINLFNALVIHGVINLGVRDSIKEVPWFFRRVSYRIGGHEFSAEDIEHGILRCNSRPPHNPFVRFAIGDPRNLFTFKEMEPRIHFSLVCASMSCPPIEVYTPENLDEELDISGRTFLNAGGMMVDPNQGAVILSKTFKWYRRDFGRTPGDLIRFLAPYLYNESDRDYLLAEADRLRIRYQEYDWRLNR